MSETDLAVGAEFEFEAGVVKDNQETIESETPSVEANNILSAEVNCAKSQETQTDTNERKCEEQKEMEEQIKILQEKSVPLRLRFTSESSVSKGFKMTMRASPFILDFLIMRH